jgi:geranylgeranyl pyrophosphate synthase
VLLLLQSGKDMNTVRDLLLKEENVDGELLVQMMDSSGALPAAKGVAFRLVEEALGQLDPIQDNKYAHGLRAIAGHLRMLLEQI